jgi:hypothetical protein
VVAHELAHLRRGDMRLAWLALWLRDTFCYLPISRQLYQQLRHDQELACDDLAVAVTGRPLALASALAKVWQHLLTPPLLIMTLTGVGTAFDERITRLLGDVVAGHATLPSHAVRRAQYLYAMLLTTLIGCGSMALLRMLPATLREAQCVHGKHAWY